MDIRSLMQKMTEISESADRSEHTEHDKGYSDASRGINKNPYPPGSPAARFYDEGQQAYKRNFGESQNVSENSDKISHEVKSLAKDFMRMNRISDVNDLNPEDVESLASEAMISAMEVAEILGITDNLDQYEPKSSDDFDLDENAPELKNVKHFAKPGGYGRKIDKDDESGDKFHSSDIDDTDDDTAPAIKRGRGRPAKNANSDTGEVPKFDDKVARAIQSFIVGNLPKNLDKIGKVSHVNRLKEHMQRVEDKMIVESKMSEVHEILQNIVNGNIDIYDIISHKYISSPPDEQKFIPKSPAEKLIADIINKRYEEYTRHDPDDSGPDAMNRIHGELADILSGESPLQEFATTPVVKPLPADVQKQMTSQTQNANKPGTAPNSSSPITSQVNVGNESPGVGTQKGAAQVAQLIKTGDFVPATNESLADTMNKFKNIIDRPLRKGLNESKMNALPQLLVESLEEILMVFPHEHKMAQDGWGMDEEFFNRLCEFYHSQGRIPRDVWHGPMDELQSCVEECYLQDTQPLIDNKVDEMEIPANAAPAPVPTTPPSVPNQPASGVSSTTLTNTPTQQISAGTSTATAGAPASTTSTVKENGMLDDTNESQPERHAMHNILDELDEAFEAAQARSSYSESRVMESKKKKMAWENAAPEGGSERKSSVKAPKFDADKSSPLKTGTKPNPSVPELADMIPEERRSEEDWDKQALAQHKRKMATKKNSSDVMSALKPSAASKSKEERKIMNRHQQVVPESKPSAGLSKEKKSAVAKKAHAGGDIGKKGKGFAAVADKAAKKYGSKEKGDKVAAAAMWKNIKREDVEESQSKVKATKNLKEMDNPDRHDDAGKKEIMVKPITVKKMKKDAEKAMNKAFSKEIPKKKVKESSDFAEWDTALKSMLNEGATLTHSVMHNGFAKKSSPTTAPKQRTDEGLADLIAMLQNAGMSADAMQSRSAQVPPTVPGTLEIEVDDGQEAADANAQDYASANGEATWDGTGSLASPTVHGNTGDDPHTKFDNAEDVPVMAMPRGMGMSQNTEDPGQTVEIEPVMADEVISDLQGGGDDDSGDATLDFIKKTMNHGESPVKISSTAPAQSAPADYESEVGEGDNYAATQGASQTGTSAGQMSMLPEEDEEVDEGNAFSGARAEAQKNHQDSFKVGDKTFPVKEEEQYTTGNGDNDEESHEVDSDATRDAGLAVGHPMGASNGSAVSETEVNVDHQSKKPSEMSLKDFIAKLDQITANRNNPLDEGTETCNECGGAMYEGQDSHRCKTMESKKAKPDFLDVDKDGDKKESFKKASKESTEKKDEKAEKAGKRVAKDIEDDEDHKGKDDDKAEKAGKKVTKDIEYDDKKDEVDESVASFKTLLGRVMNTATLTPVASLTEWANTPTTSKEEQEQFTTDVDFMTRSISGGLNNQKQDQTVVGAGPNRVVTQGDRADVAFSMGAMLKKLGGIN